MTRFYQQLSELGFDTYEQYLESDHWSDFRCRYRESSRPQTCKVCRAARVQLHHVSYERLGKERLTDVIPLCKTHHEALHRWLTVHYKGIKDSSLAVNALKKAFTRLSKLRRVKRPPRKIQAPRPRKPTKRTRNRHL